MMVRFVIALFLFSIIACKSPTEVASTNYYGEQFEVNKPIEVNGLVEQLAQKDSINVQVKGVVTSVCQKKGCWMNLATDEGNEIFVQFKDYGFFMPLDLTGNTVVLNGHAYRDVTSVEELQHYAEDEGLSPEEIAKITEPEEELKYLATGVYAPDYNK